MLKKFNVSIFVLTFALLLICPYKVFASETTYGQAVDTNRSWTIKFNDYIGFDDLTKSGVVVTDSKGNAANVTLTQGDDKKSIIVNAPREGYTPGESYTLTVGEKVHSINGKSLKEDSVLHFNVEKQELDVKEIAKKSGSVVYVEVYNKNGTATASGSGFIVSSDGKIVTNYHVIDGAYSAKVTLSDGTKYDVKGVYGYDKTADIAILKIDGNNLQSVALGDSSLEELGDNVVAIGSPEGLQNTVSEGIISSIRNSSSRSGYKDFQISVPINHGSSGGALFNMYGEVIGVTYAGLDTTGDLNFAIPINDVKKFMDITTLKTIPEVNNIEDTTAKCFPLLSDVPQPAGINYINEYKDDDTVVYFYDPSDIKADDFAEQYANLLESYGWKYYKYDEENYTMYFSKGSNVLSFGAVEGYIEVAGNIH